MHLNALGFVYSATPHTTMGDQPYQLMFGCKAQMTCDKWLGLSQCDCTESLSKSSWLQEQATLIQAKN